jgi:hypothetical protein
MSTAAAVPSPYAGLSLREIVRDELRLSANPDPHTIVDRLLAVLPADQVEEAARMGLHSLAAVEARRFRNKAMTKPEPPVSAKWDAASQVAKDRPDIFAARVVVGSDDHGQPIYAYLRDCTRTMLVNAATLLREKGAGLLRRADQYENLGRKLRKGAKVKSLPRATVEAVFDA